MRDLTKIPGTVAYCLNKHQDMFPNNPKQMRTFIIKLLQTDDEVRRADADEAIRVFSQSKMIRSDYLFLSTLTTYMTGQKVS